MIQSQTTTNGTTLETASDGTTFEATPWVDDGSAWTPEEEAANIEDLPADYSI